MLSDLKEHVFNLFWRWRQKDQAFKAYLDYIELKVILGYGRLCLKTEQLTYSQNYSREF